MPAPLRAILNEAEQRTLSELRVASCVPYRVRDRAHMILLNAAGWNAPAIAEMFDCHEHTARAAISGWQRGGLGGLWESKGRGAKPTWQADDLAYLMQCLSEDGRTYNSEQLARKLKEERNVQLSSTQIRRILKKKLALETQPSKPSRTARRRSQSSS
jgi:transposase